MKVVPKISLYEMFRNQSTNLCTSHLVRYFLCASLINHVVLKYCLFPSHSKIPILMILFYAVLVGSCCVCYIAALILKLTVSLFVLCYDYS
jgi:hypothetical protein